MGKLLSNLNHEKMKQSEGQTLFFFARFVPLRLK